MVGDTRQQVLEQRRTIRHLTRRQALTAVGGAGIAGLAGCAGQDGGSNGQDGDGGSDGGADNTSGENESGGDGTTKWPQVDQWFKVDTWTVPKRQEWNPYNATGESENGLVYEPFMEYQRTTNDPGFTSTVLKEVSIDKSTATLTLYDHHVWHNGNPVTADDAVTKLKLERVINAPVSDYVDTIQKTGKSSLELGLKGAIAPHILKWTLVGLNLDTPASLYTQFVESYESASSDEERKQARKKLTEYPLNEPIGFGPAKFKSADGTVLTLPTHDDHPYGDTFNWKGWKYKYLPSNQKTWQALKGGELDGFDHFMSPNVMEAMPDSVDIYLLPQYVGENILWNLKRDPFSDVRVRKAFAHVVNREDIAKSVGGGKLPFAGGERIKRAVKYLTGTSNSVHAKHLTEIEDQLTDYGDTNAAVTLMQDAGYTRENGTWVDDGGNPISFTLRAPACCNDLIDGVRITTSQLQQFGIQAKFTAEEGGSFWTRYGEGDFDGMGVFWGAYGKRPAYFDYRTEFMPANHPNINGFNPTVTVSELPNGDGGEIDLASMVQDLSLAQGQEAKAIIQDLAYAFNQVLPELPLLDKQSPSFMTSDVWEYPSLDARVSSITWPHTWYPMKGRLHAIPKSRR